MTSRISPILLALVLLAAPVAAAQMKVPGRDPGWLYAPTFFPSGAVISLISGDPNAAGPLVVELMFPDDYRMRPHFHSHDLHISIKSGSMIVGIGDKVQWQKNIILQAGDTATVPAGAHYYYRTKGVSWINVVTVGPFTLSYVRPSDDPSVRLPFGSH